MRQEATEKHVSSLLRALAQRQAGLDESLGRSSKGPWGRGVATLLAPSSTRIGATDMVLCEESDIAIHAPLTAAEGSDLTGGVRWSSVGMQRSLQQYG